MEVESTSSESWALSEQDFAKLDYISSSSLLSSVGCSVSQKRTLGFFFFSPFGGDSNSWITTFLPFSYLVSFPFGEVFPGVVSFYNSPLLSLEASNSKSLDSALTYDACLVSYLAFLTEEVLFRGVVPMNFLLLVTNLRKQKKNLKTKVFCAYSG